MFCKKIGLILLFLILLSNFVFSINENVILSTYLNEEIYMNQEHTKLFKINIENKVCSKKDTINVYYNITETHLFSLIKEDIFNREIGCSGYASTGEFIPVNSGNYTLCGKIINSTTNETEFSDNFACMNFSVKDTSSILCDISINITTNETLIFEKTQSIKFKTELNDKTFPFIIEYWIEDLFGNLVKNRYNTTNTNQKSWKTNIDEEDRILFIKANVYSSCNDTNLTNNFAEKMFFVTNLETESTISTTESDTNEESTIEIKKITPEKISFGEIVKVETEFYKSSTNKYSVSAYVKQGNKIISEKTKLHLKSKNTNYKITIPIQLDLNCDEKIDDGKAVVIVEGLGVKDEEKISISGVDKTYCKDYSKPETKTSQTEQISNSKSSSVKVEENNKIGSSSTDTNGNSITGNTISTKLNDKKKSIIDEIGGIVVYESSSEKAKKWIDHLLIIIFILLCFLLFCKKIY